MTDARALLQGKGASSAFQQSKLGTPLLIAVEKGRKVRILLQGHCQSSEGPILVSLCFSVKSKQLAKLASGISAQQTR